MLRNRNCWFCNLVLFAASLAVVSCGTKKAALEGGKTSGSIIAKHSGDVDDAEGFVRKVYANQIDAKAISSKIKFTLTQGQKDISVSGSLKMKKDEVIRIQLTAFGLMEVGRLEFTKDYVLVMDRMNKQYIKVKYADVSFLRNNGLDFYAVQALFWNRLFIPGKQSVDTSLFKQFTVNGNAASAYNTVSLKHGEMDYLWSADKTNGLISSVNMTYAGKAAGRTSVKCSYGSFKSFLTKKFPTDITLTVQSADIKKAGNVSVNIALDKLDTDSDWGTYTTVSGKYKQVSVEDVINRLLKL